jgi:RNA polymerase sigma factor (sigma-70 family)
LKLRKNRQPGNGKPVPPESFDHLFDRHYLEVFKYLRFQGLEADEANDLASSVFLRALEKISTFDSSRAGFKTWLFALVRNKLYNHWRDQSVRDSLPFESVELQSSHAPMPEEEAIHRENHDDLLIALEQLEDRDREIIALKFSARLSNREIAELTGLSDSNVGVILFRVLKKLKTELNAENKHA